MWSSPGWMVWPGGAPTSFNKTAPLPIMLPLPRPGWPTICQTSGGRRFGPLAALTATPSITICGVQLKSVNRSPHNTVESLKRAIEDTFSNLPRGEMTRACCRFRHRIEAVVEAEGDFIE